MPEVLSPPSRPAALPFSEFLAALFHALSAAGVRPCVLRNYQGFPEANLGNDLDLLVAPADMPRAVRAIHTIPGVRMVGYSERPCVVNVFLAGISRETESRALEIDLDLRMSWKGLPPFLSADEVLATAIPRTAGDVGFFVPSAVHEALISLMMSLYLGGWLKEKYLPQVQQIFAGKRSEVIEALSPGFGVEVAIRLADAVISGDRPGMIGMVGPLRRSLFLRSLRRRPLRSLAAMLHYYASELYFRHAPRSRSAITILAPDGCAPVSVIETLLPRLQSFAGKVECEAATTAASTGIGLVANVLGWMGKEWLSLLEERKSLMLTLREGCGPLFHGAGKVILPAWLARLIGSLTPSPALCILLEADAQENQAESSAASLGQRDACRAFLKARKRSIILDANQPIESIAESAYAAIIEALAERADRILKKHFP